MNPVNRPEQPSDEVRDAARQRAVFMRMRALEGLSDHRLTWQEVMTDATRPGGEPLRKLRLRAIATEILDLSAIHFNRRWAMFRELAGVPHSTPDRALTIAWLLDNTSAPGVRLAQWCDALAYTHEDRAARVRGFPWHLSPELAQAWAGDTSRAQHQ